MKHHIFDIEFDRPVGAIRFEILESLTHKGIGQYPARRIYQIWIDRATAIAVGSRLLKVTNSLARIFKKNAADSR